MRYILERTEAWAAYLLYRAAEGIYAVFKFVWCVLFE